MPAPSGFDHASTTKSNTFTQASPPTLQERKDGATLMGMVHAKVVKGGMPARSLHIGSPFLFLESVLLDGHSIQHGLRILLLSRFQ